MIIPLHRFSNLPNTLVIIKTYKLINSAPLTYSSLHGQDHRQMVCHKLKVKEEKNNSIVAKCHNLAFCENVSISINKISRLYVN